MPDILETIIQHVQRTFDRNIVILLPNHGELVLSASGADQKLDSSELTAAEWAFQQGRSAGYNTGTFSYASFRYFPLETSRGIIGVMGVQMAGQGLELHPEQMRMVSTFVTKAASAIDRALFAEEASQAEILRATEKLQSALLNSISHDLRTPLASITGVLSSLRMEDDFIDPETRQELVETAYGEAERLNRLVGNLLDMTRLESGMLKTTLQPCDIQDVIGSALNMLATRLDDRPVHIEIPPDLPLVKLDYVLIQQVLINLLDNAAKYSGEDEPIGVRAQLSGQMLQVSVEDNGPGIPEQDLERIFEKFYRVKRFENVVGTGLGLSICKGVVEVHGGRIWAVNRPEGGISVLFTLPIRPSTVVIPDQQEEQELQEEVQS
jgi:two-component system, OmpR family, sensor histidine kinase KdpD